MGRLPEVFVRPVTMTEGRRLQRIGRTAKDPVKLRRAIVVLMSARPARLIGTAQPPGNAQQVEESPASVPCPPVCACPVRLASHWLASAPGPGQAPLRVPAAA